MAQSLKQTDKRRMWDPTSRKPRGERYLPVRVTLAITCKAQGPKRHFDVGCGTAKEKGVFLGGTYKDAEVQSHLQFEKFWVILCGWSYLFEKLRNISVGCPVGPVLEVSLLSLNTRPTLTFSAFHFQQSLNPFHHLSACGCAWPSLPHPLSSRGPHSLQANCLHPSVPTNHLREMPWNVNFIWNWVIAKRFHFFII